MGEKMQVTGMVLSAMPVGEYDRRLVLLTRERGKLTAFARGARRMNSPLMASSNTFAFGTFEIYEGRNSFSLSSASIKEYFTGLAALQPEIYYACYFMELADYYGKEEADETQMLNLLYISLKTLQKKILAPRLIRRVFELKAMFLSGVYPDFFRCAACGSEEELTHFSAARDGVLCSRCAGSERNKRRLSPSALYTCQYVLAMPLEKLYTFQVTEEVLRELESLLELLQGRYMDRRMKSLQILEVMDESM